MLKLPKDARQSAEAYYAKITYKDLCSLQGILLTIIDATSGDIQQRKALKDVIREALWFRWVESLDRADPEMPVGMPYND